MNSARFVARWEQRLLRQGRAEGKAEAKAEVRAEAKAKGMAEGLRRGILVFCEALDIALSPARKARLASMNADELDALLGTLKTQRRWPHRGER